MKKISLIITLGCLLGLNMPLSAQSTGTENGHEWVDLGLPSGLKWATCNVGAKTPEQCGNYYAWGETKPKDEYTHSVTGGKQMDDISGNAQYDAATANWGGNWRMPTHSEIEELNNKCTWEWTKQNGVKGYKVTGPNGNSIFLPAVGCFRGSTITSASCGLSYYWSSTPTFNIDYSYSLSFDSGSHSTSYGYYFRHYGYTVRPVKSRIGIETPCVTISEVKCTDVTAIIGTYVTDGGGQIIERGFYWGTNAEPSEADNKVVFENEVGYKARALMNLPPNTTYYVKAYATNEAGTSYSEVMTFTTLETPVEYEYVDLGLPSGLKWATHNIGATTPEEYGNYYAWGEVLPKETYTSANSLTYGKSMNDISGTEYDAATFNWGGDWRMPTRAEQEELSNNCTWTWTTQNGVKGYKVTSKINGNSIFLPAAGCRDGSSLNSAGSFGYYWGSTPDVSGVSSAYGLYFYSGYQDMSNYDRKCGRSVRPVIE